MAIYISRFLGRAENWEFDEFTIQILFSDEELIEFAWGLEASNQSFFACSHDLLALLFWAADKQEICWWCLQGGIPDEEGANT